MAGAGRRWPALAGACALALAASLAAAAALDTRALTDDRSIAVPTPWWTDQNLTPQEVSARLQLRNARLVGLQVTGVAAGGEPRFATRMVANRGAYAAPGWSWHYDQTPQGITALLNANTGRLIEVARDDRGGGQIRYAVVMVANTGADARPFDWGIDQTEFQIAAGTQAFQGRIVELMRQSDGRYAFVHVRNTGSDNAAWWHTHGFASLAALEDFARQMAARPVDVVSYATLNGRRWDAAFIDNANAETARLRAEFAERFIDAQGKPRGIFQAYLKQADGPVRIDLNSRRRAETASAPKVLHLLHAMREVQAGRDALDAPFQFWDYVDGSVKQDRCPRPNREAAPNEPLTETLEQGLDRMMEASDNRTTRGVVLRYGGSFTPLNETAARAGMSGTTLRHDIGCAYWDDEGQRIDPAKKRNDTTASDLARVYEGVWTGRLLDDTNRARAEFLESVAAPAGHVGARMRNLIREEAEAQGKGAIVDAFIALVRQWVKGGEYTTCNTTCFGDPNDPAACGPTVHVGASAGSMRQPIRSGPYTAFRVYAYGSAISDMPYTSDQTLDLDVQAYRSIRVERFRGVVREALRTW